jgi:hypothetical protein
VYLQQWCKPDDIEPTKISRNWRIIMNMFSPPAALLLTDDIVLEKIIDISKKCVSWKNYVSGSLTETNL